MRAPLPADEPQRLRALHDLRVLDTPADARFDDIVARAAGLCHVPMAAITLIDAERQWTKAALGMARHGSTRDDAICSHVVTGGDVMVVPDTATDPRFCDNPLVVDSPNVRFYAGAPLVTATGHVIGALCVLDRVPRSLEPWQVEVLEVLARQAVAQMRLDAIEDDHAGTLDDLDVARRNLSFLTSHDALTGLANRQTLLRALDGLAAANRSGTATSALLVIDIDHFEDVNNELGHEAGDRVLVTIADRIHLGCRGDDIVARLASDQFVVLMPSAGALGPESLARRLLHAIAAPIEFHGATVSVTASIGVARWAVDLRSGDELMRSAHSAMLAAKAGGRNRWADVADQSSGTEATADVGSFVRMVLDEHRLRIELRPLRSMADGTVVAHEAMLRWDVPGGGDVDAPAFLSAAGALRLGGHVTRFAISEGCRAVARRRMMGESEAAVVIGVPGSQLDHDEVLLVVATALIEHELEPSALILQLTEIGALASSVSARATLRELQNMGVRTVLADFGHGLSSLGLLEDFSFDFMRVDGAFAAARTESDRDAVRALIALGDALGMIVVAEGPSADDALRPLTQALAR